MRRTTIAPSRPPLRFGEGLGRHFVTVDPLMPSDWWAFFFTFVVCGASLYSANGGGAKMVLIYFAGAAGVVLLFPSLTVRSAWRNLILLYYPAWLVLSIGWSTAPDRTLHEAGLIVPTMAVALTLGGTVKTREVNLGGAAAILAFILASLVHGNHVGFSDTAFGGDALTGLGSGKNFFGHIAAMSAILSLSFFAFGETRYGRPLVLLGIVDLAASGYALVGSHATGSILSCGFAFAVFFVALAFARVHWSLRVLFLAALTGLAVLYFTFGDQIQQIVTDALLAKFNKDSTLTGRTILWDYADRFIGDHKMLGYGYGAFWFYTNPDAWVMWRVAGVSPMSGFNFHNTIREILIESGIIGLIIYLATFGLALVRTFLRDLLASNPSSAMRLAFISYFLIRMPIESTGFAPITFDATLLLAFLCTPVLPSLQQKLSATPALARVHMRAAA